MTHWNYRLAPNNLTRFAWTDFPKPTEEFHFVDWDEASRDWSGQYTKRDCRIMNGRPRYEIGTNVVPINRKRSIHISLEFSDGGYYEGYHINSNALSKTKERSIVSELIDKLCEIGALEKYVWRSE